MFVGGTGSRGGAEEVDRCNYKRQFAGKGEKVDSVSGWPFCSMNRGRNSLRSEQRYVGIAESRLIWRCSSKLAADRISL